MSWKGNKNMTKIEVLKRGLTVFNTKRKKICSFNIGNQFCHKIIWIEKSNTKKLIGILKPTVKLNVFQNISFRENNASILKFNRTNTWETAKLYHFFDTNTVSIQKYMSSKINTIFLEQHNRERYNRYFKNGFNFLGLILFSIEYLIMFMWRQVGIWYACFCTDNPYLTESWTDGNTRFSPESMWKQHQILRVNHNSNYWIPAGYLSYAL